MSMLLRCRSALGAFVRSALGAFGCTGCEACGSTPEYLTVDLSDLHATSELPWDMQDHEDGSIWWHYRWKAPLYATVQVVDTKSGGVAENGDFYCLWRVRDVAMPWEAERQPRDWEGNPLGGYETVSGIYLEDLRIWRWQAAAGESGWGAYASTYHATQRGLSALLFKSPEIFTGWPAEKGRCLGVFGPYEPDPTVEGFLPTTNAGQITISA